MNRLSKFSSLSSPTKLGSPHARPSSRAMDQQQRGSRAWPNLASPLERRPRPPPPDLYLHRGGPRVAKIDSRRCCYSDLLPSSPSFPSSQPRARREGEEEIRRTRDGEDHSHIIDSSIAKLEKKITQKEGRPGRRWAEAGRPAAGGRRACARPSITPCLHLCSIGSRTLHD